MRSIVFDSVQPTLELLNCEDVACGGLVHGDLKQSGGSPATKYSPAADVFNDDARTFSVLGIGTLRIKVAAATQVTSQHGPDTIRTPAVRSDPVAGDEE
jgi:hypothetical protein